VADSATVYRGELLMTQYSTPLGYTTVGFQALSSSGTPYGANSTTSAEILTATATDTFAMTSSVYAGQTMGTVQAQAVVIPSAEAGTATFPVGNSSSAYNSAAQVLETTLTPLYSNSNIIVIGSFSAFYSTSAAFEYTTCLYLNSTGFPVASAYSQIFQTSSFTLDQPSFGVTLTGHSAGTPIVFNVCMYEGSAGTNLAGPYASNGLIIKEVVLSSPSATTPLVVSPVGVQVVNSATPVLLATIPVALNSSVMCSGNWFASDQTSFTTGNGGDFFFVGQRGAGNASIANSNIPSNIIGTLGTAPYISISVSSGNNAIQIYGVGAVAKTFQFYLSFNTL
jgi:hypothetical protein